MRFQHPSRHWRGPDLSGYVKFQPVHDIVPIELPIRLRWWTVLGYNLYMSKDKNITNDQGPYLSTGEAARILNVHPVAVWQMVRDERLPAIKVGRNWILEREKVEDFAKTFVKGPGRRKTRESIGNEPQ